VPLPDEVSNAVRDLLRYLLDHPTARDTVKGIHEWWLWTYSLATVEKVTSALADKGWLQPYEFTPGVRTYGLNEGAREEVNAFLQSWRKPDWRM
jgi:hypothetical protein